MLSLLYCIKRSTPIIIIDDKTRMLVSSQISDGVVLRRDSSFKDVSVSDNYKGFTYYDFCLTNLNSLGNTKNLQPCVMSNFDVVNVSDALDSLSKSSDNEKTS